MNIVVLVVLALAAGLVVGYAKRGRLHQLADPLPARNRLLFTALGVYVLAVFAGLAWDSALPTLSALSWFIVAYYAWVNRWMPGARLVAFGIATNALVLLLNGAVPVSTDAAARAGVDTTGITTDQNVEPANDSTRLSWLSKNIPVALPMRPEVVSPGDITIAAGLATILATGMTGRRPTTNVLPVQRRYRTYAAHDDASTSEDAETMDLANDTPPAHDEQTAHDATDTAGTGDRERSAESASPPATGTGQDGGDDTDATMERAPGSDTKSVRRSASA
ncbi:DUF5317 domain-containing protein [Phytoactinopolyspora halophila]|nr:DUF5317 domain-containing protein [Phytoactinopolyspora halophila]